jgi:hypothetical protein
MLRLPVVILGKGGRFVLKCKTKMAIDSGPAEFLGWIQNATFVITNSFHSTAFAIIFQKPFFTVPHSTRNARMESLLLLTGLQSRQICDVEEVAEMSCEQMLSMEYEVAGKCLNRERTKSLSFLETSLIKR